ncbi:sugar phosphate isomerase/epimerase [Candidatus Pacearchaeota archaeon]|nr:sugar phosphate isomerase/epimerase [Candidatus Pacearchaeota archaeon]
MANYEFFYNGSASALSPEYSEIFTGYRIAPGRISSPTSIQTADQLREVSSRLAEGVKAVELSPINPEVFEAIPKQHLREIDRLTKLTGGEVSLHAPMIDPSGFTREGWSESEREQAERHLTSVVERSHELNPDGNVPVTIHASYVQGTEFALPDEKARKEIVGNLMRDFTAPREYGGLGLSQEEAMHKANMEAEKAYMVAVHRETGQMTAVKRELKITPEHPDEMRFQAPIEILRMINNGEWSSTLSRMQQMKKMSDDLLEQGESMQKSSHEMMRAQTIKKERGIPWDEDDKKRVREAEQMRGAAFEKFKKADAFISDVMAAARTSYNQAYKFDEAHRENLKKSTAAYQQVLAVRNEGVLRIPVGENKIAELPLYKKDPKTGRYYTNPEAYPEFVKMQSFAADRLVYDGLAKSNPQTYAPVEDFAVEKATKTLGNVAFNAFKKFGEHTPLINIENLYSGMAFSRAEDLKRLIEGTRNQFVQQAVSSGMLKEAEAKRMAEKFIGVTWDLGHLSMMRKGGYTEKHLIEETKKIAPYVKHVHLADNFGFTDSHLPPGMATIPHKPLLTELEKAGFKGKTVIEAGAFVQHFKTSPHPFALEGLGSPMYAAYMQPFWNQARATYGGYFAGYGTMLPEQHFSMYGAGFSGMPTELGGQMPGKQSRFGGTPME